MQNYSNIQKFLHDLVLSKKIINKFLFELEKMIYLKNKDINNHSHVFISIVALMIIFNFLSNSYLNLVLSLFCIIELSVFFLIYHLIRKKFHAKLQ